MQSSGSFLRQLSGKEGWKSRSRRWDGGGNNRSCGGGGWKESLKQMEGSNNMYRNENGMLCGMKKRVMVVVDQSSHSKHAMMWALTHVTNKGDILTLLHIVPSSCKGSAAAAAGGDGAGGDNSPYLATTLGSLCKACKPEVEVEALMIQGPKLGTVMSQVKKLEVSVLVLGQKKPSPLLNCLCLKSSTDEFVEQCINVLDCLTIGVRKQSKGVSGYLISTRWHKNFWLLA